MKNVLKNILKSDQTVFSFKDLYLRFKDVDKDKLKSKLNYYVKTGDLYHIRRGLYAKNSDYDRFELATKIFIPSYISFETVLVSAGIIFQYYSQIFVATYQSREIECDNKIYIFRRLSDTILTNFNGINIIKNYSIASKERAFLDVVYLYREYHFDNLDPLDWDIVFNILPIYQTKSIEQRVNRYYKSFKNQK